MTVCSNTSVSANQSNVSGYFVDYPILAVIMSVIMGPFTEEIIYRGILFRFFSKYGELCAVIGDRIFVWNNAYAFFIWKHKYTTIFVSMVRLFFVRNTFRYLFIKNNKNIWTNISIHGTWNLIGAVMILTKIMLAK